MTKKRKTNHASKPKMRVPIEAGEMRVTHVADKQGQYVRVTVEYQTYSNDVEGLAQALTSAMYGAARNTDLRVLATQREDEIVEGEILTSDGSYVLEKWLPGFNELIPLKGRPATLDDLATLPIYDEDPELTEGRKARAVELAKV
jgi:hypothetical protein